MNRKELEAHARLLSEKVLDTLLKGQEEYARSEGDAFGNFSRLSTHLNISREKVLLVYLTKHIDGILAYASGHKSQRESVHGRIQDSIVYLMILDGMVEDLESSEVPGIHESPLPDDYPELCDSSDEALDSRGREVPQRQDQDKLTFSQVETGLPGTSLEDL